MLQSSYKYLRDKDTEFQKRDFANNARDARN